MRSFAKGLALGAAAWLVVWVAHVIARMMELH